MNSKENHDIDEQNHPLENVYSKYEREPEESFFDALIETIIYVVIILVSVVVIRYFFVAPFSVDGSSMEPNLHTEELIIVNKIGYSKFLNYKFGEPERGDIVVIIPPNDTSKFYVKRIIGLPNEKLEFINGEIIVENKDYPNGSRLDEEYLADDNSYTTPPGGLRNKIVDLGDREYYVLGDNRAHSHDSRKFGPINRANIVGKVWFIAWPFEKFRIVSHYTYEIFQLFKY